jgi:hypothetical protein
LAGSSELCDFEMLHTRRSPSWVWTASISDFCRDEEACQLSVTNGDGGRDVVSLWRTTKLGCTVAMNREPFWNLKAPPGQFGSRPNSSGAEKVTRWQRSCYRRLVPGP